MKFLSRSKKSIGLDIGSSSIKMKELDIDARNNAYRLVNFGVVPLPPEAIVDGAVMNSNAIVDGIQELVQTHRVKTKNVVASVSGNAVIIKRINTKFGIQASPKIINSCERIIRGSVLIKKSMSPTDCEEEWSPIPVFRIVYP